LNRKVCDDRDRRDPGNTEVERKSEL